MPNDKDGRDNDIRRPEETDVTTMIINMCAILKNYDEMTTTCAGTPGRQGRDEECTPASKYNEDKDAQQPGPNTKREKSSLLL